MSKTQLFSKLVDERERCRVERLKNRQNEIILEQVGRVTADLGPSGGRLASALLCSRSRGAAWWAACRAKQGYGVLRLC